MLILDTCVLIYDALAPEQLSRRAAKAIARASDNLAISDISLWEVAMLIEKGRLDPGTNTVTVPDFTPDLEISDCMLSVRLTRSPSFFVSTWRVMVSIFIRIVVPLSEVLKKDIQLWCGNSVAGQKRV